MKERLNKAGSQVESALLKRAWLGYVVAVAGTAAAACSRWELAALLGPGLPPYIIFYPVILLSALLGGIRAGLLASLMAAGTVDYFFLEPLGFGIKAPVDIAGIVLFLVVSVMISVVGGEVRRAHRRTQRKADALARTVELLDLTNVFARDAQDRIIRWNAGCQRLYGFTPEQALGKVSHQLLHTRFPEPLDKIRATLLSTGRWEGELEHTASEGRPLVVASEWFLQRAPREHHSTTAEEQAISIIEANVDITARKAAEAERDTLGAIIADSDDAVISKSLDGVIRSWNRGAQRLFGYSAAEMLGKDIRLLIPSDRQEEEEERILASIRRGERIEHYESRRLTRDGRLVDVSITASPIRDRTGQIVGVSKIARDITERKQAEEAVRLTRDALAQDNADLERIVEERTAKLREALTELEQMSYSMVHDMRAPLRAVQSFGTLLAEDPSIQVSQEGRDLLDRMIRAAARMDHLLLDMLNYSAVARGELPLGPVDVAAVVRGIVETYPAFLPPGPNLTVAPDIPVVMGNPAALTQCLAHLLSNAVKFAKPGTTPHIRVYSEPLPAPVHQPSTIEWVRIVVEDDGIGIDTEYQEKIFGMFQKLVAWGEGTGIGLAIVRKAAERMSGRVGVQSEPGKGSRFWIELKKATSGKGS